jgi:CHAT domain-containing protein
MCLNYEFHKITSLKEIIKKSANIKLDCTSKNAVVYSNPDFNNPPENLYTADIKKQPDSLSRSANDDLAYYFSSNNKGDKNKINLKPLPNSEIEAKEIVGILNRNKIKTVWYNKTNAKEEYVYNNTNPYILHFATHGTQLNEDSLDKAFLFYNALTLCNATSAINNSYYEFFTKKNDGLLTGLEITKLNLSQTELVVLSACETGKGTAENWINGTYYNSLQRAFRLAGAKAVLASKWKVPDKQTQELMVEFYTNWLEKKMTKHKALQQAQLTLSKKYPKPNYWAAWVLYGE